LTLVVVPCAYSLMSNLESKTRHRFDEHGNLIVVKAKGPRELLGKLKPKLKPRH
jgi:hypothetical protein